MKLEQVLPLQFRVDLRVMAIKEYIPLLITLELDPYHQIQSSVLKSSEPNQEETDLK